MDKLFWEVNKIDKGDATQPWPVPDGSLNSIVTSPPYWSKRNYGYPEQLGQEHTPEEYVARMVGVFRHAWKALRPDGTLWLNLGDTYMGGKGANGASIAHSKHMNAINKKALMGTVFGSIRPNDRPHPTLKAKQLVGIPWRVALALQADGWILRNCIVWAKPNPMPENIKDRCTQSTEFIFLFSKQRKYYFNAEAIMEPAGGDHWLRRNRRDVWTFPPAQLDEAHYASFPEEIPFWCIKASCPWPGLVGDPFMGAGTTAMAAIGLGCKYWGMDGSQEYIDIAEDRIRKKRGPLFT